MQRRNNNNNNFNNFRNRKSRGRQLKRTSPGFTQNGAVASRRDAVPQMRKFFVYDTLVFNNSNADFSFSHKALNLNGASTPFSDIIKDYSTMYEQYKVKRIRLRAQVGKGYTNDRRLQTYIATRVDVDTQNTTSTLTNVQSLLFSENTSLKTFTERGNILLADFRPLARIAISNNSQPLLNNNMQWYPTKDVLLHTWKGINLASIIPETGLSPNELAITLTLEVDVAFRGRITDASQFSANIFQSEPTTSALPQTQPPMLRTIDDVIKELDIKLEEESGEETNSAQGDFLSPVPEEDLSL
jgi:hypothetical protein